MLRTAHRLFWIYLSLSVLTWTGGLTEGATIEGIAPTALVCSQDGKAVYVAEAGLQQIAILDTATEKVVGNIPLPDSPSGLALSPNGTTLYATAGAEDGHVYLISLPNARIERTVPVGHTPVSPVVSPDGRRLYVCNRFNNNISIIDLSKKAGIENVAVKREPVTSALTPDGKTLVVANLLPLAPATNDNVATELTLIDTRSHRTSTIRLPVGSTSVRGVCISPDDGSPMPSTPWRVINSPRCS